MPLDPNAYPFLTRKMLAFEAGTVFELEVNTASDAAIAIEVTGMTREGPFIEKFTSDGANVVETNTFRLTDIPIMVTVRTRALNNNVNECYAFVYLNVNGVRNSLLCQGMLGKTYGLSWPTQPPLATLQKHGTFEAFTTANPAANAEWSATVPASQFWKVIGITARLVTDANAANRFIGLDINTLAGGEIMIPIPNAMTASKTVDFNWFIGGNDYHVDGEPRAAGALPNNLILPPASTIGSLTTNRQTGDNWGSAVLTIEIFYAHDA